MISDQLFLRIAFITFPVECIVRGYLLGSSWKQYQDGGRVCGIPLPKGLVEAPLLEEPIFTPSTKAPGGEHDENIRTCPESFFLNCREL